MFKKCNKCGELVKVINDNCTPMCCGQEMILIKANSVDAAFEKHVPNYEIKDKKIIVTVNHVMEEDHYIEWLAIENDEYFSMKKLNPGDAPKVEFDYIPNATIYSYCNKHSLWKNVVED